MITNDPSIRKRDQCITVRIPRELVDELDKLAKGNDRTLSGELRYLIRQRLEEARCSAQS